MLKFFSTPKGNLPKILPIIIVIILALGIVFSAFYVAKKLGLSFFPFFTKNSAEKNGLPKTPKGKVAPAPEFIERMKDEQGRSPDGKKFGQPSSPPPIKK